LTKGVITRKNRTNRKILIATLIIALGAFNVFYSCSKKTEYANEKQPKRISLSQINDSLRVWKKIAENHAGIEDSIFLANECGPSQDTTNCFLARAYRDSLNKCDKWFVNIWECKQNGRQPTYGELESEGHDEGAAFIYKRQLLRMGFLAIWDFNNKLYILKRTKNRNFNLIDTNSPKEIIKGRSFDSNSF